MKNQQADACVFFDGACPLCRREVKLYKNLLQKDERGNAIQWVDISKNKLELKTEGIKYQDAMKLIHVKDSSGVHQVGIAAVFTLWDQIPYYRRISSFFKKYPVFHPVLSMLYGFLARNRMRIARRLDRIWFWLGVPAFIAITLVIILMVFKRVFVV